MSLAGRVEVIVACRGVGSVLVVYARPGDQALYLSPQACRRAR